MRRAQPWKTERARALRSRSTPAEDRLWPALRNRRLAGFKFVRQAPIGPYFADFLCRECRLIIEVDGPTHVADAEIAADEARSEDLRAQGYRVVRISNEEVHESLDHVLDRLLSLLRESRG